MNCRKIRLISVLSSCIILIKREGKKCFPANDLHPNVSDTFKTAPCDSWIGFGLGCAVGTVERRFPVATTLQLPPMVPSLTPHFPSVGLASVKSYPVVICGPCGFLMFGNPVRCCPGKTRSVMPMRDRLWIYAAQRSCGKQTQRRQGQHVSLVISSSSTQSLSSSIRHWPRFHRHLVTKLCSCT